MRQRLTMRLLLFALSVLCWTLLFACGDDDDDSTSSGQSTDDDSVADDDGADDDDDNDDNDDDASPPDEQALLDQFQPLLIQALAPDYDEVNYPPESDLIGRLSLLPGNDDFDYLVQADTAAPFMYHFTAQAQIRGKTFQQLLYAFYYPERPLLYTLAQNPLWYLLHWYDAGAIDGKVVRITLDADYQTALFIEVMQSCGCGWQFYVNKLVDDAARAEFEAAGEEYPGLAKPAAPHDVQYVYVLPADAANAQDHAVVVDDYGWTTSAHDILGAFTSYAQWRESDLAVEPGVLYRPAGLDVQTPDAAPLETRDYQRQPYDVLYELSLDGGPLVGIFDEYGYIWNSYSPFWKLLRDTTDREEFPGTPRDPAAFEVVHETIDFWAQETLFDTFIYLPESIFGPVR